MRINPAAAIALVAGVIAYGFAIADRANISGPIDPRIDVLAIALLGILAHFAFERRVPDKTGT